MARPTTPLLSKPGIRAAALAIVDRDGLAGLSMRKLATALNVSAAAQYTIELVRCPVLVIPRETPIRFG